MKRTAVLALAAAALATSLTSCSGTATTSTAPAGSAASTTAHDVTFLVPKTSLRYVAYDSPYFSVELTAKCPTCTVHVEAAEDQATQNAQGEKAIQAGTDAIVLVAIDGASAGGLLTSAHSADVPVVAYDRLVKGAPLDYYVSFDGNAVGTLGGQAILDAVGKDTAGGAIVMLQGDPGDNNAGLFAAGAHSVLDGKVDIAGEHYVAQWSSANAKTEMEKALGELHGRRLLGVYTAYDGLAAGALEALDEAGIHGVPITGQDAETAALQRIMGGTQTMTVFKDLPQQARTTADLVADVLAGRTPKTTGTTDNGAGAVPTVLLQPQAVGAAQISSVVLGADFTTVDALCAGAAAPACATAGIS
ncbi:sugar ABC transporter substrate-binding protein [Kineococcus rubinsiae]|uniref:sugar ABC transporter substrate-binding protein n=1 Tax=Kineococcus rubinsiae TaxID=2609562 RepID=UPI00142F6B3E|nr:substrate-binding domain-containing protein [Kineococcus rubinsiae]